MTPADFLARLQAAATEQERDWLLMEFNLASLPAAVQAAVWAAAIPHWFDPPFLAALLAEDAPPLDDATWQHLLTLSYVEPFADRGYNIHERTRTLLLDHLWQSDHDRYQALSRRAAAHCQTQEQAETQWRVETLYHQLLGDLPGAVDDFSSQGIDWYNAFAYDKVEALIRPVLEAVSAGRLRGNVAAWAYYRQGRLDITYARYSDGRLNLETALTLTTNQTLKANSLQALGDVHLYLREYEAARGRYEEALDVYKAISDQLGVANCIKAAGDVHLQIDDYVVARTKYVDALEVYRKIRSGLGEANSFKALGDVHYCLEEYEQARVCYSEALTIYQKIRSNLGEANCLKALGDVYYSLDKYKDAYTYYMEALVCYKSVEVKLDKANCIQSLGNVHYSLAEYIEAEVRYNEALSLYQEIGNKSGEATCLQYLGDVCYSLADFERARVCYNKALTIYQEIGDKRSAANCLHALGNLNNSSFEDKQILSAVNRGHGSIARSTVQQPEQGQLLPLGNVDWTAALSGQQGAEQQRVSFAALAKYLYRVSYNYLLVRRNDVAIVFNFAHEDLLALAEEFVQDFMLKLTMDDFALLRSYRGSGSFTGFASVILRRMITKELAKKSWTAREPLLNRNLERYSNIHDVPLEDVTEQLHLATTLEKCLQTLSERERTVITRSLIDGYEPQTIAQELNVSSNWISIVLLRAKNKLRTCLEVYDR